MKKKFLLVCSLAFWQWFAKAQSIQDTLVPAPKIKKTTIDVVYGHYLQDGDNSAVTGGIGTEKLVVYSTSTTIKRTSNRQTWSVQGGADVISSASTDKIDFVKSSASSHDVRANGNLTYTHTLPKQDLTILGNAGFSLESDYLSFSTKWGIEKEIPKKLRSYEAYIQVFRDDLRWGRKLGKWDSLRLIYPSELRGKNWYDTFRRYSFNARFGLTQVLNKRNILGIFPEIAYQAGLLATPFHRVYFENNNVAVEQLPSERWKGSLALCLNSFVGGNTILKNTLNGYGDNFGIWSLAIENETVIKLNPTFSLLPNVRFYTQKGSPYFAPYKVHQPNERFYTSDYDLSAFQTYQVGLGMKYAPFKNFAKKWVFNTGIFRYSFMYRTNGMTMHIFSLSLQTDWLHFSKKKIV